jgi:hypothetical protein
LLLRLEKLNTLIRPRLASLRPREGHIFGPLGILYKNFKFLYPMTEKYNYQKNYAHKQSEICNDICYSIAWNVKITGHSLTINMFGMPSVASNIKNISKWLKRSTSYHMYQVPQEKCVEC